MHYFKGVAIAVETRHYSYQKYIPRAKNPYIIKSKILLDQNKI